MNDRRAVASEMKGCGIAFIALTVGFLIFAFFVGLPLTGRMRATAIAAKSHHTPALARAAVMLYHRDYGKWPASLTDLTTNPRGITFIIWPDGKPIDGWGTPLILEPYDPALGHGIIRSFGADGLPGGASRNADIEERFSPP